MIECMGQNWQVGNAAKLTMSKPRHSQKAFGTLFLVSTPSGFLHCSLWLQGYMNEHVPTKGSWVFILPIKWLEEISLWFELPKEEIACSGLGHVPIPGVINHGQEITLQEDGLHYRWEWDGGVKRRQLQQVIPKCQESTVNLRDGSHLDSTPIGHWQCVCTFRHVLCLLLPSTRVASSKATFILPSLVGEFHRRIQAVKI